MEWFTETKVGSLITVIVVIVFTTVLVTLVFDTFENEVGRITCNWEASE